MLLVDLGLQGKVALVTGGSRGLGEAICLSLAAEGAKVGVNYYRSEAAGVDLADEATALVERIKADHGVEAVAVPGDVTVESDVPAMFDAVEAALGPVEILVNNAAIAPTCRIKDMSLDLWESTLKINLTGSFLTAREYLRRAVEAGIQGHVVNIASQAAFRASVSGKAGYDSSKGGLVTFTIALAREGAMYGINVNAVAPGIIYTKMLAEKIDANREKFLDRIPLRRIATPQDIANVVVFLCSKRSSYMTGTTVDVTAGMLMR